MKILEIPRPRLYKIERNSIISSYSKSLRHSVIELAITLRSPLSSVKNAIKLFTSEEGSIFLT